MRHVSGRFRHVIQLATMLRTLILDAVCYLGLCLRQSPALAAENLFLRKQLALYEERQVKPRRATDATRLAMVWLSHWFDWRPVLRTVKPETFTRWHRQGFHLFWRWKSKPGRSPVPKDLQAFSSHGPGERHLYSILKEWVAHYNQDRPHMSLGPGMPQPIRALPVPRQARRHRLPSGQGVVKRPILGGLHHDYGLEKRAA